MSFYFKPNTPGKIEKLHTLSSITRSGSTHIRGPSPEVGPLSYEAYHQKWVHSYEAYHHALSW